MQYKVLRGRISKFLQTDPRLTYILVEYSKLIRILHVLHILLLQYSLKIISFITISLN